METHNVRQSDRAIHPCVIELREMLQQVLGEDFVQLYHYGSRVEGGADPDSDFDVLCVIKRPLSHRQKDEIMDRRMDIQMAHDALFDLHFLTHQELQTPLIVGTPYIDHVLCEGVIV